MSTKVAAIQMASGPQVQANLAEAARLIEQAAEKGAKLVVLPENFAQMGYTEEDKLQIAENDGKGPIQDFLAEQARINGVWLVGGSVSLKGSDQWHTRQSCLIYDDQGKRRGRYDKIHMFDVMVCNTTGECYQESATIEAGNQPLIVDTPFGRMGVTICYDLRFPELMRHYSREGVDFIIVPSAFTATTGKAHWETLIRARAIENLAYVIAPDQGGYHANGRETYGHTMIVDPWGVVLDMKKTGSAVVMAEIDLDKLGSIRTSFPALSHMRPI